MKDKRWFILWTLSRWHCHQFCCFSYLIYCEYSMQSMSNSLLLLLAAKPCSPNLYTTFAINTLHLQMLYFAFILLVTFEHYYYICLKYSIIIIKWSLLPLITQGLGRTVKGVKTSLFRSRLKSWRRAWFLVGWVLNTSPD